MIQAQYQQLVVQWHALRIALAKMRDKEDGLATLEVVIIAGGLAALAAALIVLIKAAYGNHTASIT